MRNWLGQDIATGTVVYRGARQGNSSSFKVGVVEKVNEDKGTARVAWRYGDSALYENIDTGQKWSDGRTRFTRGKFIAFIPYTMESKGSPGIDSLIALRDEDLFRLDEVYKLVIEWREREDSGLPMTPEEFTDRLELL